MYDWRKQNMNATFILAARIINLLEEADASHTLQVSSLQAALAAIPALYIPLPVPKAKN